MKIVNFSEQNTVLNQYLAEIRDKEYQQNRQLFRNNIRRIGEIMAYEMSRDFRYVARDVQTPLGISKVNVPDEEIVLATVFRAGLPFHQGFLDFFDHANNAFVSAYRKYKDGSDTELEIRVEYMATPTLEGKTLILVDPMLATGGSMELSYQALLTIGKPKYTHIACVIATQEGVKFLEDHMPNDSTTIWCGAIDPALNEHKYIVPGLGDAGDLSFGEKL